MRSLTCQAAHASGRLHLGRGQHDVDGGGASLLLFGRVDVGGGRAAARWSALHLRRC